MRSRYQRRHNRNMKLATEDHTQSDSPKKGSDSTDTGRSAEDVHSERFVRDKGYGRGETATGAEPAEEPTVSSVGKDAEAGKDPEH